MKFFLGAIFYFAMLLQIYSYESLGKNYLENSENFSDAKGIFYDEKNYYISDYKQGKVIIYDKNLKKNTIIENLEKPSHMHVNKDKIYISQHGNDSVAIFDLKGKKIKEFGGKGLVEKKFNHPGFIFRYENKLMILDEYNYRIQVLDMNLEFLYEILLPKFDYIYQPRYKLNYKVFKTETGFNVLDSYNKKVYMYEGYKLRETLDISYVKDPIDIFIHKGEVYILDNYDFSIFDSTTKKSENLHEESSVELIKIRQIHYTKGLLYYIKENKMYKYNLENKSFEMLKDLTYIEKGDHGKPIALAINSKGDTYIVDEKLEKVIVYDRENKYLTEYRDIGYKPNDIYIDSFDNVYLSIAGENKIKKYDKKWNILYGFGGYEKFPSNFSKHYGEIIDVEKSKYDYIDKHVYDLKITLDNNGYIYVLDSKDMKIKKYDPFFYKISEYGERASMANVIKENYNNKFSWNEVNKDNLKDIFFYKDKIYVLDSYVGKIMVFSGGKLEKEFSDNFLKQSLSSIYIKDDKIALTDSKSFKILIYTMEFEKSNEISLLDEGYAPEYIYGKWVICKRTSLNYQDYYKIIDIGDYLNDKSE